MASPACGEILQDQGADRVHCLDQCRDSCYLKDRVKSLALIVACCAVCVASLNAAGEESGFKRPDPAAAQKIVVSTGVGETNEAARKNALGRAVEEAVGVVVDAQTTVENEQLISDKILTYSDAYVSNVEVLRSWTEAGLTNIKIKATVEMRPLTQKLKANNIAVSEVSGESLFATAVTQERRRSDRRALLLETFKAFPLTVMKAEVVGQPRVVKTSGEDVTVEYELRLGVDRRKYADFAARLTRTLEDTGHRGTATSLAAEDNDKVAEIKQVRMRGASFSQLPWNRFGGPDRAYLFVCVRDDGSDRNTRWTYHEIPADVWAALAVVAANSLRISVDLVDAAGDSVFTDQFGSYKENYVSVAGIDNYWLGNTVGVPINGQLALPWGLPPATSAGTAVKQTGTGPVGVIYEHRYFSHGLFISPYICWWGGYGSGSIGYSNAARYSRRITGRSSDFQKVVKVTARLSSTIPLPPVEAAERLMKSN